MIDGPRIIWDAAAEVALRLDLATPCHVIACTYFLTPWFVSDLFHFPLANAGVTLLANHRHAVLAATALAHQPGLTIHSWPAKRMWHAKIVLIPDAHISWVMSHNLTAFAFRSARNVAARFTDAETFASLYHQVNRAILSTELLKAQHSGTLAQP